MWSPIASAPKDRLILLWFPDGPFACPATWEVVEDGNDDGTGYVCAWMIADELSEQHDGVVWQDSAQPTLWTECPGSRNTLNTFGG